MAYLKLKELNNKVITIKRVYPGQYTKFVDGMPERKDSITAAEKAEKNEKGYSAWSFSIGSKVEMDGEEYGLGFSATQIKAMKTVADVQKDEELVDLSFKVKVEKSGDRTTYMFVPQVAGASKPKEDKAIDLDDIAF